MNIQTGVIESAAAIPLDTALKRWRSEAQVGDCWTGRYRCRFFVWGRGQPLILVHGLTDQARSFVPLSAHLAGSFRCIAYNLPTGDGDEARLGALRHDELVTDLLALLDHLRIGQACLYGASFGATIVLKALARHPRRFLRAAMHGAFARRPLAPMERLMLRWAASWRGRMGEIGWYRRLQRRAAEQEFETIDPALRELQWSNTGALPIRAIARRALLLADLDLRPLLPAIRHPVMLISGDRDTVIGRSDRAEMSAGLPHADQLEFADCGHSPQYTHAAAVAEALRRFLLPPCGLTG